MQKTQPKSMLFIKMTHVHNFSFNQIPALEELLTFRETINGAYPEDSLCNGPNRTPKNF
jgi:hypothetical protein